MLRSLLFVPGDSDRKIAKCASSGADMVVLDLEDSVAPDNRAFARQATVSALQVPIDAKTCVRVNALRTEHVNDDLTAVMRNKPHAIMLPKCESLQDIQELSDRINQLELSLGNFEWETKIIAVVTESAAAVRNLMRSNWSHPRLLGMTWGAEDLAADIGAYQNRRNGDYTSVFQLARDTCLLAAKEAGVLAIDAAYMDIKDISGCHDESRQGYLTGFDAKLAIHPNQIDIIHNAFTPDAEEIVWAEKAILAMKHGRNGVATLDGKMLDKPHQKNALRILAARKLEA